MSESCLLERRNNGNQNGATNDGQTTVSVVLVEYGTVGSIIILWSHTFLKGHQFNMSSELTLLEDFFSGRNNDRAPARQTTVSFFFRS